MQKRMLFVCCSLLILALAANCGGGTTSNVPPPVGDAGTAPAGGAAAPAANSEVMGKVAFEGTAPVPAKIQMSADPYCASHSQMPTSEEVVVSDGGLENVIVYVKSGLPAGVSYPTPTTAVEIDQHDCHYVPHVFTMQVNQPLKIKNSDMTLHNIHAWAEKNTPFNIGQPVQNMETTKTFDKEEVVPIRCDVHKWMGAFVGVFNHPYHTISKGGGSYDLKLPAGKYEIAAWHEKYGEQVQMVEVMDGGKADLNFSFKADGKTSD
jgi:hypothetical protein